MPCKITYPTISWQRICFAAILFAMCFGTAFLTLNNFVEKELLSKVYALIIGAVASALFCLFAVRKRYLVIDKFTITVSIFLGYMLLNLLFAENFGITPILVIAFLTLYFVFRLIGSDYSLLIPFTIALTCLALALHGLAQYLGIAPSHSTFGVVGCFDNPAGLAACLSCGSPFCFLMLHQQRWVKWFGIVAMVVIFVVIVFSGSRAGIVAVAVSFILYFAAKYKSWLLRHKGTAALVLFALLLSCAGLFWVKKDSALGRMLIWRVSSQMVAQAPMLGHGHGAFHAEYMTYQAEYFDRNPDSHYAQLADNVTHPFNEYLHLIIEYGLIGLLLLMACCGALIFGRVALTPHLLSFISIAIFACFSYPLRYGFVLLVLAYSLSQIKCGMGVKLRFNLAHKTLLLIGLCGVTSILVRDVTFETQWHRLTQRWSAQPSQITQCYRALYRRWNHNPLFLYNYGAVLNRDKYFTESLLMIEQCEKQINDYDVQMIKGDNLYNLQRYQEAIAAYARASKMCPNRFMPLYQQLLTYKQLNQHERARQIALQIMSKPIKISSASLQQIVREAVEYLTSEDAETGDANIND